MFWTIFLLPLFYCKEFLSLVHLNGPWLDDDTKRLASTWKTVLSNGGTRVSVYPISPGEIAVRTESGSELKSVAKFILSQDQIVETLTFKDKTYFAKKN